MDDPMRLGERIAFYRRRRGLSQVELGTLVERSESWVSQVERGARLVDRLSVLCTVADALEVSVADLRAAEPDAAATLPPEGGYLDDIRLALSGHPALPLLLGVARPKRRVKLAAVRPQVDRCWELMHASR